MTLRGLIKGNNGFSVIGALIAGSVGIVVFMALSSFMEMSYNQIGAVDARINLNSYVQEIQMGIVHPEICLVMFGGAINTDPTKMAESHQGTTRPGDLTQITLASGESLVPSNGSNIDGLFANNLLKVEHLAWTDRQPVGRNGPNGFPLHQATLFGAFSRPFKGADRQIYAEPITSVFLEINPAGNLLTYCYGSTGSQLAHVQNQCDRLGSTWDANTSTCTFTAIAPPPKPKYEQPTSSSSLGKACGSVPAGRVRQANSMVGGIGGAKGYPSIQQCINGQWRGAIDYFEQMHDTGG